MKKKDWLIVALVPPALLLIPITGQLTVEGWHWKWNDFAVAWLLFSLTTLFCRFLMTRPMANLPYKAGVALGILGGFLITWVTMAVQIIGEENPGNLFYLLTVLGGFIGVFLFRFQPAGLAKVAFAMAAALLLIPVVSVLRWPADFSPGYPKVQLLSSCFAAMFAVAGLLFRRATNRAGGPAVAVAA